jgi:anti-sigma factor RsiW
MDECRRTAERVTPYVDGALPPGERREVEQHLQHCPPCARGAQEEQGARTVLRERADRLRAQPLPPGLRSRCEALAHEHSRVQAVRWWRLLVPATAIAVLLIFAGVLIFAVATRRSDTLLAAQLTADHVKCFEVFVPEKGADASEIEEELESKFGWDMHVPPSSSAAGITLLGGRRCLYADGSMPHVMYKAEGAEPVSLFRLEGVTRKAGEVTTLGHHCRIWSRGGNTYVLVLPKETSPGIARLARYVEREAR